MPSPDFTEYVDLTIYDESARSALSDILSYANGLLPTWQPKAGQIETVIAEAIAVRSAELSSAINRLPGSTTETLLKLFGITRDDGRYSTATIEITFSDSDTFTRTLAAGTRFLYYSPTTGTSLTFVLDEAFTLSGSLTGTANVTAVAPGSDYNVSAVGSYLTLLTSATFFVSATFTTNPSGGTDEESDNEYFDRAVTTLASYTQASVTPDQIKSYILSNKEYAYRANVYDQRRYRDRDATLASYTTHPGYVLVTVAGPMSSVSNVVDEITVSASNLSDLYNSLVQRVPTGVVADVMTAEIAQVDVTVNAVIKSQYQATSVRDNVVLALQRYLNPNNWDFNTQTIRINEIISLVDSVDGIDYVTQVYLNGDSLLGVETIGYYGITGSAAASANVDISGATDGTLSAGSTYYFVDTSADPPSIYVYALHDDVTISGGTGSGIVVANGHGVFYNDINNGGKVTNSGTLIGTDSDSGDASIDGDLTGGLNGASSYTPFPVSGSGVQSDAVFRNLGTLPVYGTLTVNLT